MICEKDDPEAISQEVTVCHFRLAKISVWNLVGLGFIEIAARQFTGSIGLTADGIDSISDRLPRYTDENRHHTLNRTGGKVMLNIRLSVRLKLCQVFSFPTDL